jgi:Ca-activated chloride channel family protein
MNARTCFVSLFVAGCGSADLSRAQPTEPSPSIPPPPSSYHAVAAAAPPAPSIEQLLPEALAGTVAAPGDALDGRVEVRKLDVPKPPRGASATFQLPDRHRAWIAQLPSGTLLPSPTYSDGKVLVGGGYDSQRVYAFDATSGRPAWALSESDIGPSAAIAIDKDIAFNTVSCDLYVAKADTGEVRWHKRLASTLMTQPAAADGVLLTAWPQDGGGYEFGAWSVAAGEREWGFDVPADVIAAPQVAGDSVYFSTLDGTVFRVRRRDGHVIWKKDVGATSAVAVADDRVLLARRVDVKGTPHEQRIVLDAETGELRAKSEPRVARYLEGSSRDRTLLASNAAFGAVPHGDRLGLKSYEALWGFQSAVPAIADGRAYAAIGGQLVATEIATGKDVWTRSYRGAADAQALTPPAVVGSELVFGSIDGHLYVADIDTGMTIQAWDLGDGIVAQPIVAQGWIYVTTAHGKLIGLELGDPSIDGWHMWGGNAQHAGLVPGAGTPDAHALAALTRPGEGTLLVATPDGPPAHPLPLLHTKANVTISGYVAEVTLEQQFTNPSDAPIDADYLFPLPDGAAVDQMDMHVGDRVIHAEIGKRAEAAAKYADAKRAGKRAALLEQARTDLFSQKVANIPPKTTVTIAIRYAHELPFDQGEYEYTFPMVAAPRFDPKDATAVLPKPDELRAANSVEVAIDLHAGLPIESLASPTHRIDATRAGDTAHVALAATDRIPNRDFVLRYRIAGDTPRAAVLAHRDGSEGYFSLLVEPPAAPTADQVAARELMFVIDTSSSMRGKPLAQAQAIVDRVLDTLQPDDRFDIFEFGDAVHAFAPAAVEPARRADGKEFVAALRPAGGTNMVPAIEAALAAPPSPGRTRIVVLISDGYIANEADVMRAVVGKLGAARLYTAGVGGSVNRFLLDRTAEIGRGRAIQIALSDAPDRAATRLAQLVDRPVFTDVDVDWGGLDVSDVYPRHLPDLFASAPLVVHGRFTRGGKATVRVRGSVGDRRYERTIEVTLPETTDTTHEVQRSLWAEAAVTDRTNRLALREDPKLATEIEELGLRYHLVTPFTSLLAVDEVAAPASLPTVSPGRALPGDPEIRIPAPADAREVSVLLPSGESVAARWDSALELWTARFLIPSDAREGSHPLDVFVTHADGSLEHVRSWYDVDTSAPKIQLALIHGVLRATDGAGAVSDLARVTVRTAGGELLHLHRAGDGVFEAPFAAPEGAAQLALTVVAVDLAANVRTEVVTVEVAR